MRLEQVVEIIEFTDTDHLAHAMEVFNQHGFVSDALLPFLGIVFEQAPDQLCDKLNQIGFKGKVTLAMVDTSTAEPSYVIFNADQYNENEAIDKVLTF
ncbi:hypothetical protein ACPV4B_20310 [Vibrio parahaemolyticus]|uniref:hypothetical protein n=1 Tax=Vibrio mediterranei TaxID=689 RepID=UPI004067A21D